MYAFLLALGVIVGAIGIFAIGFGIPIHEFSFGNTLIVAGTVALIGGLVLIGLAAAVRQLRRIADGMGPRPVARRQPAPEGAEAAQRAPGPRIPYPPKPGVDMPGRDQRPAEPRAAMPAPERPEEAPERPRPNIFGVARGANGTTVVDEAEAVPLAPTRMPAPGHAAPMPEPVADPKLASSDLMARLSNLAAPPRPAVRPEPPRPAPAAPRPNMFDSVWPAEVRAARARAETIPRAPKLDTLPEAKPEGMLEAKPEPMPEPEARAEPKPEPRPEPKVEFKVEPKFEPKLRPEPRFEPPMTRERSEPAPGSDARSAPPPVLSEPRPIAILKSGVIDGMAYTLYTDGSIEAELPQGTMRFASIDELRAHLEKAERSE